MKTLLIVESPSKAKTISGYLKSFGDYIVLSSAGHIMKLPSKDGSVDIENNFEIKYEIIDKAKKNIDAILKATKECDEVLLATDPDREGEVISWCLEKILLDKKAIKQDKIKRVTFNEITKKAIFEAIKNPRELDHNLIEAQKTRTSLDYIVGFKLSPVLWRKLKGAKSAGRVQSVALRMIVERELEIKKFISKKYWSIIAELDFNKNETIKTEVISFDDKNINQEFPNKEEEIEYIVNYIKEISKFQLIEKNIQEVKRNPYAPYITSTLQQDASSKIKFSPKKTMQVAQKLYEGIQIGKELKGLITYMRTDSIVISDNAIFEIRNYITETFKSEYLNKNVVKFKSKAKNAQEAHEAIRPTDISIVPDKIKDFLSSDEYLLYKLIWNRTICTQMSSAIYSRETLKFKLLDKKHEVVSKIVGSRLIFDGFLKVLNIKTEEDDFILPELKKDEKFNLKDCISKEHHTLPSPRFTEASLIKNLEELGIGRPSTYVSIISTIQDRGYAEILNKAFQPSSLGILVSSFLTLFFKKFVEYDFTSKMEEDLDLISDGKNERVKFLRNFWQIFNEFIEKTMTIKNDIILEEIEKQISDLIFTDGKKCDKCENGQLRLSIGKFGPFISCNNYPECKYIKNIFQEISSEQVTVDVTANKDNIFEFDQYVVELKNGRFGRYFERRNKDNNEVKNCSIPKTLEKIDFEIVKFYSQMPLKIGNFEEKDLLCGIGKFGPYVLYDKKYYSYKGKEFHKIDEREATEIIKKSKK